MSDSTISGLDHAQMKIKILEIASRNTLSSEDAINAAKKYYDFVFKHPEPENAK